MNIVDYIIVGILFVSAVHGWYIGFILSFFNIAGYIIAGILAKLYYSTAAIWIAKMTNLDENINSFIKESMGSNIVNTGVSSIENGSEVINEIPSEELNQMIENLPSILKTPIIENINGLSSELTGIILNILGIIGVFIVALILIKILVAILNTIAKIPGLKEINRGGGLILGTLKGAIVVLIGFFVLTLFIGTNPNHIVSTYVFESQIGLWIYQHNILIWLIKPELFT